VHRWILGLGSLILALALVASACGREAASQTLTIYSGRSEELVGPIIDQFSKATDIKVEVRYASTSELAATILEEGGNSPADVFLAQDPGGLGAVEHLFAQIADGILSQVELQF